MEHLEPRKRLEGIACSSSEELCRAVAERSGGEVILAFSRGKDALAALFQLRKYFQKVHLYHLYTIPHLSFVDESLAYFEREFGVEILNLPHPSFYRWLRELTFQAPENCSIIEDLDIAEFDYSDIYRIVRRIFGAAGDCPIAQGVRSADSIVRRLSIQKHGALNSETGVFFPVYDWKKDRVIEAIKQLGVSLPVDYEMFGRSLDGIDWRFIAPIRERFPEDFAKIKAFFPLCDLELFREEVRAKWHAVQTA